MTSNNAPSNPPESRIERCDVTTSKEEVLNGVAWMENLPLSIRSRVHSDAYETFHVKGDSVVRTGDPSTSWMGVADGLLKVSVVNRAGKVIMFTGVPRGGWIGEGAVIKRELRRYDIVAMRETRLIHIPSTTVRWLLDTSIEFNHVMLGQVNERLSQYIAMVEIDRLDDPVARVAKSLATLFNPVLYPHMTAAVPLSQTELGELVGLSRQSISAALKQLGALGHITTEYGGVVVKDLQALRNFYY
jgi:CRP-like cAMP-binding protein